MGIDAALCGYLSMRWPQWVLILKANFKEAFTVIKVFQHDQQYPRKFSCLDDGSLPIVQSIAISSTRFFGEQSHCILSSDPRECVSCQRLGY